MPRWLSFILGWGALQSLREGSSKYFWKLRLVAKRVGGLKGREANQDTIVVIERVERWYTDRGDRTQGQECMGWGGQEGYCREGQGGSSKNSQCELASLEIDVVGKAEEMNSALALFPMESPFFPLLVCSLDSPDIALGWGPNIHTILWTTNGSPDSKFCSLVSAMGGGGPCSYWEGSWMQPILHLTKFCRGGPPLYPL